MVPDPERDGQPLIAHIRERVDDAGRGREARQHGDGARWAADAGGDVHDFDVDVERPPETALPALTVRTVVPLGAPPMTTLSSTTSGLSQAIAIFLIVIRARLVFWRKNFTLLW